MGDFTDRDLEKVVVVVRNLDGSFSLPTPGGGTGSDVNVTNAQIPVILKDVGGDSATITGGGLDVNVLSLPVSGGGLTDAQLRASPVPVSGPLTDTQLRAAAIPVSISGSIAVTGPLTDTQLRATAVPVSGTFWQATQPVSGPLTDTQLRATAVPVSGPLTDAQLRATAVPIADGGGSITVDGSVNVGNFPSVQPISDNSGSLTVDDGGGSLTVDGTFWQATQPVSGSWLTDTQLRATALPVSGTFWQATQPVSGPLTDAQLRASVVAVDTELTPVDYDTGAGTFQQATVGVVVPGAGGAVNVTGDAANGLDVDVTRVSGSVAVTGTFWQATQPVSGTFWQATQPVSGPLTDAQLRATAVPVSFSGQTVTAVPAGNASSSVTQVASSATNVTLKASNASRKGLSIQNDSTQTLFVKLGATASATSYTVKVTAGSYYEVPFNYTGIVDGIWASANGNAYVTEVT